MASGLRSWASKNPRLLITIAFVLWLTLTSYTGFFPYSGPQLPQPTLRLFVLPPGYPAQGGNWNVQIWQKVYPRDPWVLASNSTLLLISSAGNFSYASTNGSVNLQYSSELGKVSFLAEKSGFGPASWQPETSFVSNELAYLVAGFYIFGGGLSFYEISFEFAKRGPRRRVLRALSYAATVTFGSGYILAVAWLQRWNLGTAWGFGNDILDGVGFVPHLLALTIFNVLFASVIIRLQTTTRSMREVVLQS